MSNENLIRQRCNKCNHKFQSEDYYFDEHGTGYATKLARCPCCGSLIIVGYILDYAWLRLGNLGMDSRYYTYK